MLSGVFLQIDSICLKSEREFCEGLVSGTLRGIGRVQIKHNTLVPMHTSVPLMMSEKFKKKMDKEKNPIMRTVEVTLAF